MAQLLRNLDVIPICRNIEFRPNDLASPRTARSLTIFSPKISTNRLRYGVAKTHAYTKEELP